MSRPSVTRSWESLGITRRADQRRLGKEISVFWKSRLSVSSTKTVYHSDIAHVAQAFIDQCRIAEFAANSLKDPNEILESVARLIQAQRRTFIDNTRRDNLQRNTSRRHRQGTAKAREIQNKGSSISGRTRP